MSQPATTDSTYVSGGLSTFPTSLDTTKNLYVATNNSVTTLRNSLSYNGKFIVVQDASSFPDNGILILSPNDGGAANPEMVYYNAKSTSTFTGLQRGFAGSIQTSWTSGNTSVSNAVFAEHHNAIKDAILNIEAFVGIKNNPTDTSLNGILQKLESRYLSPKPLFRAFPRSGPSSLNVRFQNFSYDTAIRYFWDFGDGTNSVEKSPFHTYQKQGIYTVKLTVITITGAQGQVTKANYITVNDSLKAPFFYVAPTDPLEPNYSIDTAAYDVAYSIDVDAIPQEFIFVDQTDKDILQRYWVFDDGTSESVTDPDIHTIKHTYQSPGTYSPSLVLVLTGQQSQRAFLNQSIIVS